MGFLIDTRRQRSTGTFPTGLPDGKISYKITGTPETDWYSPVPGVTVDFQILFPHREGLLETFPPISAG